MDLGVNSAHHRRHRPCSCDFGKPLFPVSPERVHRLKQGLRQLTNSRTITSSGGIYIYHMQILVNFTILLFQGSIRYYPHSHHLLFGSLSLPPSLNHRRRRTSPFLRPLMPPSPCNSLVISSDSLPLPCLLLLPVTFSPPISLQITSVKLAVTPKSAVACRRGTRERVHEDTRYCQQELKRL